MIPKVFHTIWVGGPMPEHLAAYLQTWRDVHPDWCHEHWDDERLAAVPFKTGDLFDQAPQFTEHVGQFRADVARYELLYRFGGVYVDCDFEALRPIDPLLDTVNDVAATGFAAWETDGVWINNAIVGAEPGAHFLHRTLRGIHDHVRENANGRVRPNVLTGPQYITPIWRESAIHTFASAWFYPYLWNELDRQDEEFSDAYAVHHWDNARKRAAVSRVRTPGSLGASSARSWCAASRSS